METTYDFEWTLRRKKQQVTPIKFDYSDFDEFSSDKNSDDAGIGTDSSGKDEKSDGGGFDECVQVAGEDECTLADSANDFNDQSTNSTDATLAALNHTSASNHTNHKDSASNGTSTQLQVVADGINDESMTEIQAGL